MAVLMGLFDSLSVNQLNDFIVFVEMFKSSKQEPDAFLATIKTELADRIMKGVALKGKIKKCEICGSLMICQQVNVSRCTNIGGGYKSWHHCGNCGNEEYRKDNCAGA